MFLLSCASRRLTVQTIVNDLDSVLYAFVFFLTGQTMFFSIVCNPDKILLTRKKKKNLTDLQENEEYSKNYKKFKIVIGQDSLTRKNKESYLSM